MITAIRPRELYFEKKHSGRIFPTGSGGRIIDRFHPASGSEIIIRGSFEQSSPGRKPVTYYDVEVLEGARKGEIFRVAGLKEKLWLEEPFKSEIIEEKSEIKLKEYVDPPEGLSFEEVPSDQYPLFRLEEYDLPKLYERVLDEIFGRKRDYSRPLPTAKQLAIKLGLTTKTAKFYLDTLKKGIDRKRNTS